MSHTRLRDKLARLYVKYIYDHYLFDAAIRAAARDCNVTYSWARYVIHSGCVAASYE